MSPTTPGAHPSPEEVDALLDAADVYDVDLEQRVGDHVAGCAQCTELLEGMRQVRALLRREGAVPPAPPHDLDARLGAAIARASAERAGTIVPLHGGRRGAADGPPPRVPRWLTVAAGIVVIGGAGLAATQLLPGSGTRSADSLTAGDAASGGAEAAAPQAGVRPVASGTDYTPADLPTQVDDLLASVDLGGSRAAQDHAGDDARDAAPLADPAGLAGCLTAIGADASPVAVDLARWQGRDAAVIVLPGVSGPASVRVWVVAPDCRPGADGLITYRVVNR